ncbi:hypothetical protein [Cellulomonas sp. URHB0016]
MCSPLRGPRTLVVAALLGALSLLPLAPAQAATSPHRPVGWLDSATQIPGQDAYSFAGWVADQDVAGPIHFAARIDGELQPVYDSLADGVRPDVGAAYPGTGDLHGFSFEWWPSIATPTTGTHEVCFSALEPGEPAGLDETNVGCTTITLPPLFDRLVGTFEEMSRSGSGITFRGWAMEPSGRNEAKVYIEYDPGLPSARVSGYVDTDVVRYDVAAAYPGMGAQHGFTYTMPSDPGYHSACVWALLPGRDLKSKRLLGCKEVGPDSTVPFGNFESLASTSRGLELAGWALDPQVPGPIAIDVYLDDALATTVSTTTARADVGRAYPGTGDQHGYSATLPATPGPHWVCLRTKDPSYGVDVSLGCRKATVTAPVDRLPFGNVEALTSKGLTVTFSGWALDPDTAGPIDVHLYVNGAWGGALRTTGVRTDVAAAYPGTGDKHGFSTTFTAGPGTHNVCAYAINTTSSASTSLGCRTVTVANKLPLGNFESLSRVDSKVTLGGWALDPDTAGPIEVHVYVNGRWGGALTTSLVRTDVGRAYPGTGDLHGFTTSFVAGPGTHQVCLYAIDTDTRQNTTVGCRSIAVP